MNAVYTVKRSREAVDFMMDGVLRPVFDSPAPPMAEFASENGYVMPLLDRQRATGKDLW